MNREPMRLTRSEKARLSLLFIAKHALGGGVPHAVDGSHAVYHHELLTALRSTGIEVIAANSYDILFDPPRVDFVVPLLNRGGFLNSEMLAPLLLTRAGLPYLGATPILRGLSDDKHLMKMTARARGVRTTDWRVFRRGAWGEAPIPAWDAMIVKPNASSASWGVERHTQAAAAMRHVSTLHAEGHDAIVEPWVGTMDIAVPVIGDRSSPWLLPPLAYEPEGNSGLRSYEEKRNLVAASDDVLVEVQDLALVKRLEDATSALIPELWPFDYGRFEFRHDRESGALWFMEVNLSCNLWSKKTISRAAGTLGIDHNVLVEHIVAQSMLRQGVIRREARLRRVA